MNLLRSCDYGLSPALARALRCAVVVSLPGILLQGFHPVALRAQGLEELETAGRTARKQLESSQASAAKELQELESRIAEATKANTALRDSEKKLSEKLRELELESQSLSAKAQTSVKTKQAESTRGESVRSELHRQLLNLKDRLSGSVVTAQDEQLLDTTLNLHSGTRQSVAEQVPVLFEIYERLLGYAQSAALVQIPVRIAEDADRIENLKVLRLGLVGGYFSRPAAKSAGFVLADPTAKAGFVAESRGLTNAQKQAITAVLQKPDKGGFLPIDVTGGAALASLQTSESIASWFRRGGIWMWPILGLGLLALVFAFERGLSLCLKYFSVRNGHKKAVSILRSDRRSGADSARLNGSVGKIFEATFDSRDRGRAAMEAAVQGALVRQEQGLHNRLGWMAICGSAAALLGFLGTVTGLVGALKLSGIDGYESPTFLAGGVAEALITTQAGLAVAGICFVLRGLLAGLAETIGARLESTALSVLSLSLSAEDEVSRGVGARV